MVAKFESVPVHSLVGEPAHTCTCTIEEVFTILLLPLVHIRPVYLMCLCKCIIVNGTHIICKVKIWYAYHM